MRGLSIFFIVMLAAATAMAQFSLTLWPQSAVSARRQFLIPGNGAITGNALINEPTPSVRQFLAPGNGLTR